MKEITKVRMTKTVVNELNLDQTIEKEALEKMSPRRLYGRLEEGDYVVYEEDASVLTDNAIVAIYEIVGYRVVRKNQVTTVNLDLL